MNDVLYHYSPIKLKEICSPVKIPNYKGDITNLGLEAMRISLLPLPIPIEKMEEMNNQNFIRWANYENLYINEIRLSDLKKVFVAFMYESKKEPILDLDRVFDLEKKQLLTQVPDITSMEFDFFKSLLKTKFYHRHGLIYSSSKWNDLLNMINNSKENWEEDIDYNIKYGDKNQYASFIPHFNIMLSDCVKVSNSYKIV